MATVHTKNENPALVFQAVLLRLYTDALFLEAFLSDRQKTLEAYNLPDRERAALFGLSAEELRAFNQQLRIKKNGVVSRMLYRRPQKGKVVFLLSSYKQGPALFIDFLGKRKNIDLTEGVYRLFKWIADRRAALSFRELWKAYTALNDRATAKDIFEASRILSAYRLSGKYVRFF